MRKIRALLKAAGNWIRARYEGASWKTDRPLIPAGYHGARFDADAHSRMELARKMRFFERNDELVQALAGKFENFVVGASPQLTPASSDPEWNKRAKVWWEQWARVCDLSSRHHFGSILNLAARRWFIEGDVFILLTTGRDDLGRPVMPRIQLVEGHLCRTPPKLEKDPRVHDGVRMDDFGRPLEYWFAEEIGQGQYEFRNPRNAESVIPVFEPERPGEVRGISHFHACIGTLEELRLLHTLEMQAAAENASTSDWIETQTGEMDPVLFRKQRLEGAGTTHTGAGTTEPARMDYYREVGGARTRVLMRGDKIHQHSGERPSVTTVDYWRLKRELVCAAVEIPYCIVFPDSMQGTVYRGALDMATAAFKSRHAVIAEVQRRIWVYVMGFAIRTDPLLADPPADWFLISILPPRAPNVDVGRNATAEAEALADGRTNYDLIYGPLGLSWQEELRKYNAQLEFIKKECPALQERMDAASGAGQAPPPGAPPGGRPAYQGANDED